MSRIISLLLFICLFTTSASAFGHRPSSTGAEGRMSAWAPSQAKADTIALLGGPGRTDGKFDDGFFMPDWEGWTSVDLTARGAPLWNVSPWGAPSGGDAVWCGETFTSCETGDPAEGYGNHYEEYLDWTGTVADAGQPTDVTVVFDLNIDVEPGYDHLTLLRRTDTGWVEIADYSTSTWNATLGVWEPLLDETHVFTVPAVDLTGPSGNAVHLRFRATSDHLGSDADCMHPSAGHSILDDIVVSGTNGLAGTTADFSTPLPHAGWYAASRTGVGDFADIWSFLIDLDLCISDDTPLVAFIDDGNVEPCSSGTLGISWTYGPGGYVHNLTGGCAGPTFHMANEIWSPVIEWADGGTPHPGAVLAFDMYDHLPLQNGLFADWGIRTSADGGATWTGWQDHARAYYGSGNWKRMEMDVSDLIVENPTHVQIALGVHEWGWLWNLTGPTARPPRTSTTWR